MTDEVDGPPKLPGQVDAQQLKGHAQVGKGLHSQEPRDPIVHLLRSFKQPVAKDESNQDLEWWQEHDN